MTGTVLRRFSAWVGAAVVIVASVVLGGSAAAAQSAASSSVVVQDVGIASHRTWACTVPSGYTWSAVRASSSCASNYQYFLLDAVNVNLTGVWACGIPSGYTYTASRQGTNCAASPGASPYEYRLARV